MEEEEFEKCMLDLGISDLREKTRKLESPIHLAFKAGNLLFAKELVARGYSLTVEDGNGNRPATLAAEYGHLEMLKWANEVGAVDVLNDSNAVGDTSMTMAVFSGHLHIMNFLHGLGVDLEKRSHNGFSLTMIAAENDRLEALQWLVEHGCNIHDTDLRHNNPIILAAHANQLRVATYLVEKGADLGKRDEDGFTPILLAAQNGNLDMMKLLIANGANLFDTDADGDSVSEYAARSGKLNCLRYVLDQGVPITSDIVNSAVLSGCVEMVKMLLPTRPAKIEGYMMESIARSGHLDMLKFLITEYIDLNGDKIWQPTDGVWEHLLTHSLQSNQLPFANYIMQLHGANINEHFLQSEFSGVLRACPKPETLDWMACRIPKLSDVLCDLNTRDVLSSGEESIKWLIQNGWECKNPASFLNPFKWSCMSGNGTENPLEVLVKHFGWTAQDLDRTIDGNGTSLSPLMFAIANRHLLMAKYLVEIIGVPFPSRDDIEASSPLLGCALRSDEVGVVKWVLEKLSMTLPNIFVLIPRQKVMKRHLSILQDLESTAPMSPSIFQTVIAKEYLARDYAVDDLFDDDSEEEEPTFLDELTQSDSVELFAWCYKQCEAYDLSRHTHAICTLIFMGDSVNRLAWLLDQKSAAYSDLTALIGEAALCGATACVQYLFSLGGSLYTTHTEVEVPLSWICVGSGTLRTFKWWIANGAVDIHRKYCGHTLIHHCIMKDCYEAFIVLVMRGASVIEPTVRGQSPISLAKVHSPQIYEWFVDCGFQMPNHR